MKTASTDSFRRVFEELRQSGFLLESDIKLPSVCTLVTGEPMRGSWWSHPLAQVIFQVNEGLEDHKDVLITKLISRKVTFVHRKLWPQILAVGIAREPWQMNKLPEPALLLLEQIEAAGSLTTDQLRWSSSVKMKPGDAARELEKNLLIVGTQFHTESGTHAKLMETWEHWAHRRRFKAAPKSVAQAKKNLELRLCNLNRLFDGSAKLPWQ